MTKKEIFKRAWLQAHRAVRNFGGKASQYFPLTLKAVWAKAKLLAKKSYQIGNAVVTERDGKIFISSRYNRWFVKQCHKYNARWNRDEKVWVFPAEDKELVLSIVEEAYA